MSILRKSSCPTEHGELKGPARQASGSVKLRLRYSCLLHR